MSISKEELNKLEKQATKLKEEELELECFITQVKTARKLSRKEKNAQRQFLESKRIFAVAEARLDEIRKFAAKDLVL